MRRAESGFFKGTHPAMASISLACVVVFVAIGALYPELIGEHFSRTRDNIIDVFKWYYILVVSVFLGLSIYLVFSRLGSLRLGDDDQLPEFSYFTWFSMLFGAGMGIGLLFYAVSEPLLHYQANPFLTSDMAPTRRLQTAMRLTIFHWGLHPWAIYAIIALSLSFFAYRRKLPLTIRSALYPLIGERIYGPAGHVVDVLAVFATVFGVSTSLGFGVAQLNAGLHRLFNMPVGAEWQFGLLLIITLVATLSVVSGVARGVRFLSELNLWLSFVLLAAFLALGPTTFLLNLYVQSIGDYLQHLVPLSFWTHAGAVPAGTSGWQARWTAFYWGWWLSWAPFVGMFIARISKGRTLREFVLGVLLVPTLLVLLWLVALGGTALHHDVWQGGHLGKVATHDVTTVLYEAIGSLSGGALGTGLAALASLLIVTYFITSADSGTLVITTLLSLGLREPLLRHRIFWGLAVGVVAAVLLLAGGLEGLQAAVVIAALPFSVVMLLMTVGLVRALRDEAALLDRLRGPTGSPAREPTPFPLPGDPRSRRG